MDPQTQEEQNLGFSYLNYDNVSILWWLQKIEKQCNHYSKQKKIDKYKKFQNKHTFVNIIYNTDKLNQFQNSEYEGKTESFHLS